MWGVGALRLCDLRWAGGCSTSAGVDVGNVVGSTTSVAQPQRGIEWPAAAAWAATTVDFIMGPGGETARGP